MCTLERTHGTKFQVKTSLRYCERNWIRHARLWLICLMFRNNHTAHFRKVWPLYPASFTKYEKPQRVVRLCAFSRYWSVLGVVFCCTGFDSAKHALMSPFFLKQEPIQHEVKRINFSAIFRLAKPAFSRPIAPVKEFHFVLQETDEIACQIRHASARLLAILRS